MTGKVFKVTSQGTYQNANVTLTAYVDMPLLPEEVKEKEEEVDPDDPFTDKRHLKGKTIQRRRKLPLLHN